jgi:DNA-binding transcriptional ArsR family regulator
MIQSLLQVVDRLPETDNPDTKIDILRSVSALRTTLAFIDDSAGVRQPRIGQVIDDIELLSRLLFSLGIVDAREEFRYIAKSIRELL